MINFYTKKTHSVILYAGKNECYVEDYRRHTIYKTSDFVTKIWEIDLRAGTVYVNGKNLLLFTSQDGTYFVERQSGKILGLEKWSIAYINEFNEEHQLDSFFVYKYLKDEKILASYNMTTKEFKILNRNFNYFYYRLFDNHIYAKNKNNKLIYCYNKKTELLWEYSVSDLADFCAMELTTNTDDFYESDTEVEFFLGVYNGVFWVQLNENRILGLDANTGKLKFCFGNIPTFDLFSFFIDKPQGIIKILYYFGYYEFNLNTFELIERYKTEDICFSGCRFYEGDNNLYFCAHPISSIGNAFGAFDTQKHEILWMEKRREGWGTFTVAPKANDRFIVIGDGLNNLLIFSKDRSLPSPIGAEGEMMENETDFHQQIADNTTLLPPVTDSVQEKQGLLYKRNESLPLLVSDKEYYLWDIESTSIYRSDDLKTLKWEIDLPGAKGIPIIYPNGEYLILCEIDASTYFISRKNGQGLDLENISILDNRFATTEYELNEILCIKNNNDDDCDDANNNLIDNDETPQNIGYLCLEQDEFCLLRETFSFDLLKLFAEEKKIVSSFKNSVSCYTDRLELLWEHTEASNKQLGISSFTQIIGVYNSLVWLHAEENLLLAYELETGNLKHLIKDIPKNKFSDTCFDSLKGVLKITAGTRYYEFDLKELKMKELYRGDKIFFHDCNFNTDGEFFYFCAASEEAEEANCVGAFDTEKQAIIWLSQPAEQGVSYTKAPMGNKKNILVSDSNNTLWVYSRTKLGV